MGTYKVVCFGEILWDRLPSGDQPGGAPMNVSYHLSKLGHAAALISKVGKDELGDRLLHLLEDRGLQMDFIQTDGVYETGVVVATVLPGNEVQYEIRQPVAWDFIESVESHASLVQQAQFLVFGSLATRNKTSRDTLFSMLENPVTRVLDINLRAPHFTKENIEALMRKTDVLKLNENELPLVSKWFGNYTLPADQLQLLQDTFGIKTIMVTCGASGALLNLDGRLYRHPGYRVTVKDTVGSGDAFLAGFLHQTIQDQTPDQRLAFANRTGAFIASKEGACPAYDAAEITETKMGEN